MNKARRAKRNINKAKAGDSLQYKRIQRMVKLLSRKKELTEEESKALLEGKLAVIKRNIENLGRTCKVYQNMMEGIVGEFNCFQFQMIGQDLANIQMHIKDLEVNGPKTAHRDVPLEDSEMDTFEDEEVVQEELDEGKATLND